MVFEEMKYVLEDAVLELKPAPEMMESSGEFEMVCFDGTEQGNHRWSALITPYLKTAKTFEIHCWNEEVEWIALAEQYGERKNDDWKYGKIVTGIVTQEFIDMILRLPKPADTEIYNKMTPFFNVFLDDCFQSCHYGTENYRRQETVV